MKKLIFALSALVPLTIFSCKKDKTEDIHHIDISKFVDKHWFMNGHRDSINTNDVWRANFNSDHTGSYTQCTWLLEPYRYSSYGFTWERLGEDTILLNGFYPLKIRSVNDSVLVTNGKWTGVGTEPGENDTSSVTFKYFPE